MVKNISVLVEIYKILQFEKDNLIEMKKLLQIKEEDYEKQDSVLRLFSYLSFVQKLHNYIPTIDYLTIKEDDTRINNIIKKSHIEMNTIMDNWCKNYDENFSGGKMRGDRGLCIENFVKFVINMFSSEYDINVRAVKGSDDKKELKIPGTEIKKDHQVDIHIYKNNIFIAIIECKAYLDSCYYTRSCNDFILFKKFGYNIKKYIFALEDSIKEETKQFIDYQTDNVCDGIFYMLDGKRTSTKPVYDKNHKKNINKDKLTYFLKSLEKLFSTI